MNLIIVFAIIIFIVTIFVITKQFNLEGYETRLFNINFSNSNIQPIEHLKQKDLTLDTCDIQCNDIETNTPDIGCSGYKTNIPHKSKKRGFCHFYGKNVLNKDNLMHIKYEKNSNLYIK